jgi:hypothetical protein
MINRQMVLEYLNKHPSHTNWQMRLHFLQATREIDSKSSVSISSIANQLNYILRDLESIGTIPTHPKPSARQDSYYSEYSPTQHSKANAQEQHS